jgi:ArsR family transcriptional regulator, arsenate/arsenite/antimonite-responsive transcriptional repressor
VKKQVALFKALSDETRFKIVALLDGKELCVCQIESALGLSQVKVSRHLTILRYAGLVKGRREGPWIYYSLVKPDNELGNILFKYFRNYARRDSSFLANRGYLKKVCINNRISNKTNGRASK